MEAKIIGGASRMSRLNVVNIIIEVIKRTFDHIGSRKGGPMLKTAATRIYWKEDSKNKTVFS